jgi:predicted nucleic acid-binding protein
LAVVRPVAVTNTSPIIALVGVGRLDLFGVLFERVIVPFEVWSELIQSGVPPALPGRQPPFDISRG